MADILCVVGVGDAGGFALNTIREVGVNGVTLIAINTYGYALSQCQAHVKIQLGSSSMAMGAGGSLEMGKKAAEESRDALMEHLESADQVVIVAGMGGGTGSGAAPVIAKLTKGLNIKTSTVVTQPTTYEGIQRKQTAARGISVLQNTLDDVTVINTDRLIRRLLAGTDYNQRDVMKLVCGALAWEAIFKLTGK